ncbi:MAG: DUF4179 domain-containing protein [Turicibacter sp.]|nr:DUF4179 domain-containing protein [Turicibacter sp.]
MVDRDFLNEVDEKQAIDRIVALGLEGRKRASTWKQRLVIDVAAVVIGLLFFGLTFPALAQHIPLIGGLFERADLHESERMLGLAEDATVIGEMYVSDGVSVTLSELFFDGDEIYVAFLVESKHAVNNPSFGLVTNRLDSVNLIVDGREIAVDEGIRWRDFVMIDEYSFLMMLMIYPMMTEEVFFAGGLPETDDIELFLSFSYLMTEIGYGHHTVAAGPWHFQVPMEIVERDQLVIDQTISYDGFELITLTDVTFSPAGMRFNFVVDMDRIEQIGKFPRIRVTDEWGNAVVYSGWDLETMDLSLAAYPADQSQVSVFFITDRAHEEATQLIVTPVIVDWHFEAEADWSGDDAPAAIKEIVEEWDSIMIDLP